MVIQSIRRLQYSIPEEAGIDSRLFRSRIDSFCQMGINSKLFPGCQVLVAKEGTVVWQKSYGYHTYQREMAVQNNHLYDLASLTKILGPLPLLMQLVQDSIIMLDKPFANYWTDFKGTDKSKITLREILTHQAQLKPGANYAPLLFKRKTKLNPAVIRNKPSEHFTLRVSSQWYARSDMTQQIYSLIKESTLLPQKKYAYSDMGFVLFPPLISQLTGQPYENLLYNEIFKPIGAYSLVYNPSTTFPVSDCIPTELDETFRKELLQGYVHDEVCALIGGVAGHAGLFGTSNDIAKLMQMYLQNGQYGGTQYIKPSTLKEFTRVQYPSNENRRALGFDKPYLRNNTFSPDKSFPAKSASESSYGHTGFTGTFAWCDPQNNLLFIFLSNRVHPTRTNTQLSTSNFRPKLHEIIYQCTGTFSPKPY
jgi:beta-N-acetylhexosaminidase